MIFITFHGGSTGVSNIFAYSDDGKIINAKILSNADNLLHNAKLRDMIFCNGYLYVANGRRRKSQILRFKGKGLHYDFDAIYTSHDEINSIDHPFAMTFDKESGYCFISNQDSNVVVRLILDSGKPAPLPRGLPSGKKFLPGTFVASSQKNLPGVQKTKSIHTHQGLKLDIRNNIIYHSVRSVLLHKELLYVCDEQAGLVKTYNKEGSLINKSNNLKKPTHLIIYKELLYVSCRNSIQAASLNKPALFFKPVKGSVENISGMTVNSDKCYFYAANRKKREIYRYNVNSENFTNTEIVIKNMPDDPEFLLYIKDL